MDDKNKLQNSNGLLDMISVEEFDAILNAIHDDILIIDKNGAIIYVSSTFEEMYKLRKEDAIGKSVHELEKEGYFKPSISAIVLKSKEPLTMAQKNMQGRDIVVSATPVFDCNGDLQKVVSFSRDITDYLDLETQYSELKNKMERYEEELDQLRNKTYVYDSIITADEQSQTLMKTMSRIAEFDTNVLLTGESGVGKSVYAKAIHHMSRRNKGPYIEINCGAIPGNLLESELFGYEAGSFTGADKKGKIGLIELSEGGTLFLDEIGELPLSLQVKILNVIQNKKITRVGGVEEISVDFRLVTATNKDLEKLKDTGEFRKDLYYRLNVISIDIPPLRERREDIIPLTNFFVNRINKEHDIGKKLSQEVYDALYHYSWPGNIRELENTIERTLITSENKTIKKSDLPKQISTDIGKGITNKTLEQAVESIESEYVNAAYEKTGTTIGVAKELDISQPTAVRKIHKYVKNNK